MATVVILQPKSGILMKTEIILRITNKHLSEFQSDLATLLKNQYQVQLIDDSDMSSKFIEVFKSYSKVVSLSSDISCSMQKSKNFEHLNISRVFDRSGNHIGWSIPAISDKLIPFDTQLKPLSFEKQMCVIDSDIATGTTREMISRLFPKADFFAPLKLANHQDLIDIEDLIENKTPIWVDGFFERVSYLVSRDFFVTRTSLNPKYYDALLKQVSELRNLKRSDGSGS